MQIEEPFSIIALESIFDATQAAAQTRDRNRSSGSTFATTATAPSG